MRLVQQRKINESIGPLVFLSLGILALVETPLAKAADALFIGGGQAGGQNSSYGLIGIIAPLPSSSLGNGWIARAFFEEITYRYKSGGRDIDAQALGGNVSLGYQLSGTDGWWGVYAGPAYLHTDFSPADPTNKASGGHVSARVQLEGERNFSANFKANANASYETNNDGYWSRLRLLYRLTDSIYAGPQGVYQGDNNYKAWSLGVALVGIKLSEHSSIGINAGVQRTHGFSAFPYAGLEFGLLF